MSKYMQPNGKPRWKARSGFVSHKECMRKRKLQALGLLPPAPLYSVEEALKRAGLE